MEVEKKLLEFIRTQDDEQIKFAISLANFQNIDLEAFLRDYYAPLLS